MEKLDQKYPFDIREFLELMIGRENDRCVLKVKIERIGPMGIALSGTEWSEEDILHLSDADVTVNYKGQDALYQFPAKVKPMYKDAAGRMLLYDIGAIKRIQRREFVRINYSTPLEYSSLGGYFQTGAEFNWSSSSTSDISAGGLSILSGDGIKEDDLLLLRIKNRNDDRLPNLIAARCRQVKTGKSATIAGVEFIRAENLKDHFDSVELARLPHAVSEFGSNEQNRMVNFILDLQVKKRLRKII